MPVAALPGKPSSSPWRAPAPQPHLHVRPTGTVVVQVGHPSRGRSLDATAGLLSELVANLTAHAGWDPRRLHLFGFSQGGTAALHAAAELG